MPGVSVAFLYPLVVAGERRILVQDDEPSLTTATVSSGVYYQEYRFIDSGGMEYSVKKVTEFGRKNAFFDMGTQPLQVFLEMKPEGLISLKKAQALLLETALKPDGSIGRHGAEIATKRNQGDEIDSRADRCVPRSLQAGMRLFRGSKRRIYSSSACATSVVYEIARRMSTLFVCSCINYSAVYKLQRFLPAIKHV